VAIRIRLPSRARLRAIARQRCPHCLEGHVFAGPIRMKERCTLCGHEFMREQGYFQGAMYLSYGLGLILLGILATATLFLLPSHSPVMALVISIPAFLALVPVMFRYSRIIWMHLFYHAF
jgi:uncharacterized protein (DUF983 family)